MVAPRCLFLLAVVLGIAAFAQPNPFGLAIDTPDENDLSMKVETKAQQVFGHSVTAVYSLQFTPHANQCLRPCGY